MRTALTVLALALAAAAGAQITGSSSPVARSATGLQPFDGRNFWTPVNSSGAKDTSNIRLNTRLRRVPEISGQGIYMVFAVAGPAGATPNVVAETAGSSNTIKISASVVDPAGNVHRCRVFRSPSGSTSAFVANAVGGDTVVLYETAYSPQRGIAYSECYSCLKTGATDTVYLANRTSPLSAALGTDANFPYSEGVSNAVTDTGDLSITGVVGAATSTNCFAPVASLTYVSHAFTSLAVGCLGDSTVGGLNDNNGVYNGTVNQELYNAGIPCINCGVSGECAANVATTGADMRLGIINSYCTHGFIRYGYNDIDHDSQTAAQVIANLDILGANCKAAGLRVIYGTLWAATTTSLGGVTQTASGSASVYTTLNADILADAIPQVIADYRTAESSTVGQAFFYHDTSWWGAAIAGQGPTPGVTNATGATKVGSGVVSTYSGGLLSPSTLTASVGGGSLLPLIHSDPRYGGCINDVVVFTSGAQSGNAFGVTGNNGTGLTIGAGATGAGLGDTFDLYEIDSSDGTHLVTFGYAQLALRQTLVHAVQSAH